jgi:glycosyltransferase involved in cell wall biosynthesis
MFYDIICYQKSSTFINTRGALGMGKTLFIQIPCFNEEETLPITLGDLPRTLPGISKIEWLVIDDGSTDRTSQIAKECGVNHVIRHLRNQGLARAFLTGIEACIELGADVIVNTDADNQYCAQDIPRLIAPILNGEADYVIGSRPIESISTFSQTKKILQNLGSWLIRRVSNTPIKDTTSGFRALSRNAAQEMHVFNDYTYTLETIIQAGQKGMAIKDVSIRVNKTLRPSRLIKNIPDYLQKSIFTIIRIFMTYQPFIFFVMPGGFIFFMGILLGIRFLYYYLNSTGSGHIQSLILMTIMISMGGFLMITGLIADLISVNRKLLERIDLQIQRIKENQMDNKNE